MKLAERCSLPLFTSLCCMHFVSQSRRIILRELTADDAAFILELVNDPDWLRFIGDREIGDLAAARRYIIDGPVISYREHGFGLWAMTLRDSGTAIGLCGFLKREELDEADLGYALLPAYRHQGYALESCRTALEYGASALAQSQVLAIVSPDNQRSIRLLEKLGFVFLRTFKFGDEQRESHLYRRHLGPEQVSVRRPPP